ncbi:MAG: NADP-dependent malic enzyme [Planctomycetes bacterium]|nr:NADP-dependent malic enzyme [Planctomycetota bacterium]
MPESIYQASLKYHQLGGRPGKIEVVPTKPTATARDLSLAYSPGVAEPCRQIEKDPEAVYKYTNRGNLVAVITNGTAVLGLGDIGPLASKPVMEGKAVLFKKFADIDVFDIELDAKDPARFIETVCALAPTFGGINLEDIKGPECFEIEAELRRRLDIPVFHDDQHGTAIISAAAMLNALELTNRKIGDVRCVFNGAGAAGISCARLFIRLGIKAENVLMCDSKGVIHNDRNHDKLSKEKKEFVRKTKARSLADAMVDADVFIGCSVGDVVTPEMLKTMAKDPIVFAMANPTPEIDYPTALAARSDVIMATGRSDYPNQVNNVLGFPFIFRGALDCGARTFNEEMKLAAVHSLAALAKEPVPSSVSQAYGGQTFEYGRDYLIPKPFDQRVLYWESVAVARAAMETGVARKPLDLVEYRERLRRKVDAGRSMVAVPLSMAQKNPPRIAIPDPTTVKLAQVVRSTITDGLAFPVLVGQKAKIEAAMEGVAPDTYEVIDPVDERRSSDLIALMQRQRPLDNPSAEDCAAELLDPFVHATLLVEAGICDGLLAANDLPYAQMVKPVLRYASRRAGVSRVAGVHLLALKDRHLFIADTTLIPDPSAEELTEIALRVTRVVRRLAITPRVAFVSYANFSRRTDPTIQKLRRAYRMFRQLQPDVEAYPDVQADVALDPERFRELFGDKIPAEPANILIFPNLHSATTAYRLARVLGGASVIGPMLLGLRRPANVLPRGSSEDEILNLMAITAYNAARRRKEIFEGRSTRVWRPALGSRQHDEDDDLGRLR